MALPPDLLKQPVSLQVLGQLSDAARMRALLRGRCVGGLGGLTADGLDSSCVRATDGCGVVGCQPLPRLLLATTGCCACRYRAATKSFDAAVPAEQQAPQRQASRAQQAAAGVKQEQQQPGAAASGSADAAAAGDQQAADAAAAAAGDAAAAPPPDLDAVAVAVTAVYRRQLVPAPELDTIGYEHWSLQAARQAAQQAEAAAAAASRKRPAAAAGAGAGPAAKRVALDESTAGEQWWFVAGADGEQVRPGLQEQQLLQ